METPQIKRNTYFKTEENIYYKMMVNIFKTLQILFGLDYGFFYNNNSKYLPLIKTGSFLQCLIFSSLCWIFHDTSILNAVAGGILFFVTQYVIGCSIFLLFRNGTSFYDFNNDIQNIDLNMGVKTSSYKCEKILILTVLNLVVARIVAVSIFCMTDSMYCLKPYWINPIFLIESESFNLALVVTTIVYYGARCRLLKLLEIAKKSDDYGDLQKFYKLIANLSEKYKTAFDPVIIHQLILTFLQVMSLIYVTIIEIHAGQAKKFHPGYFIVTENLCLLFTPPIVAGLLSNTAEQLKILLHEKLSLENDRTKCRKIDKFIHYIEARPLKFKIWGLMPLNAHFITIVLNFCITYLIVIIQFTII